MDASQHLFRANGRRAGRRENGRRAGQLILCIALGGCGASADDSQSGADASAVGASDAMATNTPNAAVYGHSDTTLYEIDPGNLDVQVIGAFSGCEGGVIDIAVDKDSHLYGTTFTGLYQIDIATAVCTLISTGSYPNSLSFVPVGVLDPTLEVLVAFRGSEYIRIDRNSGAIATLGSIEGFSSSGDVVSVEGGATYLTARGSACSPNDCLLEINPATGALVKNWGQLDNSSVWGLAFWGGVAYGFADNGSAFAIHFDASSVTTSPISIPNAPSNLSFWGAGSTTIAPIIIE